MALVFYLNVPTLAMLQQGPLAMHDEDGALLVSISYEIVVILD